MSEKQETPDQLATKIANEKLLASAITHAVNMESAFKMYAYRCITPDQFNERVKELIEQYGH